MLEESHRIIQKIETHQGDVFKYPRSEVFASGLYNNKFEPIFTLIKEDLPLLNNGYNKIGAERYYLISFVHTRYFNARYLVIAKKYNNSKIIRNTLIIFLTILIIVFSSSIVILKTFSRPFREVNEYLDRFIKNSIHEINTPLAIINVNSDLLKMKLGGSKYINRIKAATKTLSTIYDDMSFFIKKDRLEYPREYTNLSEFVASRVEYFQSICELKNINIEPKIDKDIYYNFNKVQFERLIDNNISNAIKYNKEGSTVKVVLKKRKQFVRFMVIDYGIGIENPKKVSNEFYREDETKGGFGIGLNIVSNITNNYGIRVKIFSKLGKGSIFVYDMFE